MLKQLYIRNYALFTETRVEFPSGLNILTGETGAGKSLLVGALGLINGKRADSSVVFQETEKCIVEARFGNLPSITLQKLQAYEEFDMEDDELLIRREINPNGKSRAFINDTPVSLQILRQVASSLVDLHSQHENQSLLSADQQLEMLDTFADCHQEVLQFGELLKESEALRLQLRKLEQEEATAKEQQSFIAYQVQEFEAAKVVEGEEEALEQELSLLQNSEEVIEALGGTTEHLYHSDESLYVQLSTVLDQLKKIANVSSQIAEECQRLEEMRESIKDSSQNLQQMLETVESDPERLAFIEERLGVYHQLKIKYKASSSEQLIEIYKKLAGQLDDYQSIQTRIDEVSVLYKESLEKLERVGLAIERKRHEKKGALENSVNELLKEVGFEKAQFYITVERFWDEQGQLLLDGERVKATPKGINKVQYDIQTNPGMPIGPLAQIASGGEISRVMLAIKTALAAKAEFPVLIFDEIDAGISGEIANKVGLVMQKLSQHFQILSITHLPQIAAKGKSHFSVNKEIQGERTRSSVRSLNTEERVRELAIMLSGEHPTESAMRNAAELISMGTN